VTEREVAQAALVAAEQRMLQYAADDRERYDAARQERDRARIELERLELIEQMEREEASQP
jgi:hypothetical protein